MTGRPGILEVIIAPDVAPVGLEEMKRHLRVQNDAFDELIADLIDDATAWLDGPTGYLRRCLVPQTLRWTLGCGDVCWYPEVQLPCPPLIAVDEIAYVDTAGAPQTIDPSLYIVEAGERRTVRPAYLSTWPAISTEWAAPIVVTYQAGYSGSGSPGGGTGAVPRVAKLAIRQMVTAWFERALPGGEVGDHVARIVEGIRVYD